jgi:hypothetical protein
MKNVYQVKELSYRSKAKKPYVLLLNEKPFRRFDTEERAIVWRKYYSKFAKYHKPKL